MKEPRILIGFLAGALVVAAAATVSPLSSQRENGALEQQVTQLEASRRALMEENRRLSAHLEDEAPIDRFFDGADAGNNTAEMNFFANTWADAWEAEARAAAEWLKGQLLLEEDRALVDAYVAAAEDQSARMRVMSIYPSAALDVPQEVRAGYSGTLCGVLEAGGRQQLWRDTFYQLLYAAPEYDGTLSSGSYVFQFDADAAQRAIDDAFSES